MKKAQSSIPEPISDASDTDGSQSRQGAVYATDSESDLERARKANKQIQTFKWTKDYEDVLEEILLKNEFNFSAASREFSKLVN